MDNIEKINYVIRLNELFEFMNNEMGLVDVNLNNYIDNFGEESFEEIFNILCDKKGLREWIINFELEECDNKLIFDECESLELI